MAKQSLQEQDNSDAECSSEEKVKLPMYIEPSTERFKKQGLTRYHRRKHLEEIKEESLRRGPGTMKTTQPSPTYICLCYEFDDGTETFKCSSELCPVGWFHFRCTGLARLPTINEKFFCCYCSPNEVFTIRGLSGDEIAPDLDLQTPKQPCFPQYKPTVKSSQSKIKTPRKSGINKRSSSIVVTPKKLEEHGMDFYSPASTAPTSAFLSSTVDEDDDGSGVLLPEFDEPIFSSWGVPVNTSTIDEMPTLRMEDSFYL